MARHFEALRLATTWCATVIAATMTASLSAADAPVSFVRDVKPLLARRCFSCHGPTAHEGGLRLDKPDTAVAELDSGLHAIVPGHLDQSALVERVSASDPT